MVLLNYLMSSPFIRAVAIMITTMVGAGIYGLPYAINKSGLLIGLGYLLIFGFIMYFLHLLYGEIILRTEGEHQLAGYGEIYLGKWGKRLAIISLFVGIYGALLAYIIKTGQFLALVSNQPYPVLFSLLFFIIVSIIVYVGYQIVSVTGVIVLGVTIGLISLIGLIGLPYFSLSNFQLLNSSFPLPTSIFSPYGIILFALVGTVAIPEVEKTLRDSPQLIKRALFLGTAIPVIIYLVFSLIIIGICGQKTSNDAISGLTNFLPIEVVKLGALLGIATMSTAFISLGYILRKVWQWDYGFSKPKAFFLAVIPALVLFLLGNQDFIGVLDLAGALTGGLTGILIILMFVKAKKMGTRQPFYSISVPQSVLWVLGLVFALGMLSPFIK